MSLFSLFSKKKTEEPAVTETADDREIVAAAISLALAEHLNGEGVHDAELHRLTIRYNGNFGPSPWCAKAFSLRQTPDLRSWSRS